MMDVNIASLYPYHINIEDNPMIFIAYDCAERVIKINTGCAFEVLVAMYDVPKKNVDDLKLIIEKLKRVNLDRTKSITIYSKYQSDTWVWIKLERIDLKQDDKKFINMCIHYHPGDSLIELHRKSMNQEHIIEVPEETICQKSQYGTFCETRYDNTLMKYLNVAINRFLVVCTLFLILCVLYLFFLSMHIYN